MELILRDGYIAYNRAIENIYLEAIQISNKFNILKNLTNYLKKFIIKK